MDQNAASLPPGVSDALALGSIVGTLMGVLPAVAALFAIIWYCILIYEWVMKRFAQPRRDLLDDAAPQPED